MKSPFIAVSKSEFILYLREPSAFFFTLIFPLLMMLLFASMWGNDSFPDEEFGYVDFSVPAFMGLVMVTSFVMSFTTSMAAYREKGILKRFRAAPVTPFTILAGQLVAIFAITVAGVILLLIAGFVFYDLKLFGNVFEFVFVFLLSSASIAALGFIPASLAPTARSGAVIANILYFPMIFLSGAALPWFMLPDFLKDISLAFPLTHAIKLMQGVWLGGHFWDYPVHLMVLAGFILAGLFVSGKYFKWE
ncbi:MAG: ABC transporter permease [Candidatus Sabulitectum sp.]|nr:ABC transporter permease [Candidatus Sabulitectum sp.]